MQTANSFMLMQGSWDEEISWDEIKQKWLSPHKGQLIKVFRMSRLGLITDEDFGVFDKGEINND